MMDLMMRRRALMKTNVEYAVTSAVSPKLMAKLYEFGWAKNPNYMTVDEAKQVTDTEFHNKLRRTGEQSSLLTMAEDFSGFKYFTKVTSLSYGCFRGSMFTSFEIPSSIEEVQFPFANTFRQAYMPNVVLDLSNVEIPIPSYSYTSWVFAGSTFKSIILGEYTFHISHHYFDNVNAKLVLKRDEPPSIMSDGNDLTNNSLYVPDTAVQIYKDDPIWGKANVFPLSEYNI